MQQISRRGFLALVPLTLAGCAADSTRMQGFGSPSVDPAYVSMYGPLPNEKFPVPAMDVSRLNPTYLRQEVSYQTSEYPGTIVVDPANRFLYLVQENGRAMRYGVGVGRAGYDYQGDAVIQRKGVWPRWTPTPTMIAENPQLNAPWANGMEGGPQNPLGARALYLYNNGRDTLYRIHGTNDPTSIGRSVSSGCVRLFNHDIIDLHRRVPTGTRVVVNQSGGYV